MLNFQSIALFVVSYFIIPRLTFLPSSIHTLIIIFGPFLLPRLVNLFNTARATSRSVPVRPVPPKVQNALNLLFVSAVACLVLSLPRFAPENIFLDTQSRLQIEVNTLFTRLKNLRPLTADDEVLRKKFSGSIQNKLVYLAFGPDTLINCIWCSSSKGNSEQENMLFNLRGGDNVQSYLLYSLPKILKPHIIHLGVLGLATTSMVGSEGSRFRTHVTIAGLVMAAAEVWFLATFDIDSNKKSRTVQDMDFVHWRLRVLRYIAFALVDGGLGLVLWLTSTNRWLAKRVSLAERIEQTTREADTAKSQLRALSILSNSINRDSALRAAKEGYWRTEADFMSETIQDQEVMEQINNAINSMDFSELEKQVGEVADAILADMDRAQTSLPQEQEHSGSVAKAESSS